MPNALLAIKNYFRDSIAEMKKVVWPNKKQIRDYTLIVIALSLGIALFFAILDYGLNLGLGVIIR